MTELHDWQWAMGAAGLFAALVIGGWLSRRGEDQAEDAPTDARAEIQSAADHDKPEIKLMELQQQLDASNSGLKQAQDENQRTLLQLHQVQEELEQARQATPAKAHSEEHEELRHQLQARESDLQEAREEAELTLLQLHQVQEELEHYFLESRALQKKLDATSAINPSQQEKLKRIHKRLLSLCQTAAIATSTSGHSMSQSNLIALVQRQQKALLRFQAITKTM